MESLAEVSQIVRTAASSPSSDQFSQAGMALVKARDQVREELQKQSASTMKPIIQKLEKNQPLSLEEKDLVKLWIVGDAEGYTKKENDYVEWLEEFKRLGEVIGASASLPSSLAEILDFYGSLEDAVRVAADLQFFLEEKERVARFEQAIQNLSKEDAELLAGIL
ncbi:MAG TPA: hypothetical protein VIN67_02895, partial [Desulfobaccales bacterium]